MDIQRGVGREEEKNPRRGTKAWREIEGGWGGRRDEGWEESSVWVNIFGNGK